MPPCNVDTTFRVDPITNVPFLHDDPQVCAFPLPRCPCANCWPSLASLEGAHVDEPYWKLLVQIVSFEYLILFEEKFLN